MIWPSMVESATSRPSVHGPADAKTRRPDRLESAVWRAVLGDGRSPLLSGAIIVSGLIVLIELAVVSGGGGASTTLTIVAGLPVLLVSAVELNLRGNTPRSTILVWPLIISTIVLLIPFWLWFGGGLIFNVPTPPGSPRVERSFYVVAGLLAIPAFAYAVATLVWFTSFARWPAGGFVRLISALVLLRQRGHLLKFAAVRGVGSSFRRLPRPAEASVRFLAQVTSLPA